MSLIMKKFISLSLILIGLLCLQACQKSPSLEITDPSSLEFSAEGGSATVTFSTNTDWSASVPETWCKVTPSRGSSGEAIKVTVTCNATTSYDSRSCQLLIMAGDLMRTVKLEQLPALGIFPAHTEYDVTGDEQILDISVYANVEYSVFIDSEWIHHSETKSLSSSTISLAIDLNSSDAPRSAEIVLNRVDVESPVRIKINQSIGHVSFEDDTFRSYIVNNFDLDGDGGVSFKEARSVKKIDCTGLKISSLNGIQYFTSLTSLLCSWNKLRSLDLSACKALEILDCSNNWLGSIDLTDNAKLKDLKCAYCNLSSIDVRNCPDLSYLDCSNNMIASLDVSGNKMLVELVCGENYLSALDLSSNTSLSTLKCYGCAISSLELGDNTLLTDLDCSNNMIASLDVSGNTSLTRLDCGFNNLSSLNVSGNTALSYLDCSMNELVSLDIRDCTSLTLLYCSATLLESLDVSMNALLESLNCEDAMITSLDVSNNPNLSILLCWCPMLTEIWLRTGQTFDVFQYDDEMVTLKYVD